MCFIAMKMSQTQSNGKYNKTKQCVFFFLSFFFFYLFIFHLLPGHVFMRLSVLGDSPEPVN